MHLCTQSKTPQMVESLADGFLDIRLLVEPWIRTRWHCGLRVERHRATLSSNNPRLGHLKPSEKRGVTKRAVLGRVRASCSADRAPSVPRVIGCIGSEVVCSVHRRTTSFRATRTVNPSHTAQGIFGHHSACVPMKSPLFDSNQPFSLHVWCSICGRTVCWRSIDTSTGLLFSIFKSTKGEEWHPRSYRSFVSLCLFLHVHKDVFYGRGLSP